MEFAITSNQTTAEFDFPCIGWFCDDKHLPPGSPALNAKSPTGFQAQFVLCSSVGTLCFLLFCFLRVRLDEKKKGENAVI
jgi:hypothetical protein